MSVASLGSPSRRITGVATRQAAPDAFSGPVTHFERANKKASNKTKAPTTMPTTLTNIRVLRFVVGSHREATCSVRISYLSGGCLPLPQPIVDHRVEGVEMFGCEFDLIGVCTQDLNLLSPDRQAKDRLTTAS